MKIKQAECSETLAHKIQMQGNYPEESRQHSEDGESLKSGSAYMLLKINFHPFYSF
jgi:hypothetical protein